MSEAKDTPTRAKVLRLAQDCDLAKVTLASNGSFSTGQIILHECASTLRALSAALERAERERDDAREALEKVRRERDEARARAAAAYEDAEKIAHSMLDVKVIAIPGILRKRASDPERDALAERDASVRAEERERAVKKLEDHFPGTLHASNRTRCAAAIRGDDTSGPQKKAPAVSDEGQ